MIEGVGDPEHERESSEERRRECVDCPMCGARREEPMKLARVLELAALVFSVLTGALSVGLLVFEGGKLVEQVRAHEVRLVKLEDGLPTVLTVSAMIKDIAERVNKVETAGSPPMQQFSRLEDERHKNLDLRVERMEAAISRVADALMRVDTLGAKVDALREEIRK